MTTVAIIANPLAGKGQWRTARTAAVTEGARVAHLRSLIVGAVEGGAERVLLTRDRQGLSRRAVGGLNLSAGVELLDVHAESTGADSSRAAALMRNKGAGVVVVAGGDGTIRDVCRGWQHAPIIAVATGTNAAFGSRIEPTIAGMCAGLVASHASLLREFARDRSLMIHVEGDGIASDLAVVTAAVLGKEPATTHIADVVAETQMILNAVAEPWNTGMSSIAGLVAPTSRADDRAVLLGLDKSDERRVRAPVAPGEFLEVRLRSVSVVEARQMVYVKGPAVIALDGDLTHRLVAGQQVSLSVRRDGPRVIDVQRVYAHAVRRGLFVHNSVAPLGAPTTTPSTLRTHR